VRYQPAPVANFTANVTSGWSPATVLFTDTSTGTPTLWAWDIDNNSVTDYTTQNTTHTYTSGGKYSVKLNATNAGGSNTTIKTDYITISEVNFTATPTSGENPLLVNFYDTSINYTAITSWNWSFGDTTWYNTTSIATRNTTHTYSANGNYTVSLYVTADGSSHVNTKTNYITVCSLPLVEFVGIPTCGDPPHTAFFIDYTSGAGLYAWNWSFGDGNYSTDRNPYHNYYNGTWTVALIVWGTSGNNTKTKTNYITVPCPVVTPTPTPTATGSTPTPTTTGTGGGHPGTAGNITWVSGETWIRWDWNQNGTVDIYIDGDPYVLGSSTLNFSYLQGLNPSERHRLTAYDNQTGELRIDATATTLPSLWIILLVLGIAILFTVLTLIQTDIYRVLITALLAVLTSLYLTQISLGYLWGVSIIGILLTIVNGALVLLILADIRRPDND
jgi:PKD repeat protein